MTVEEVRGNSDGGDRDYDNFPVGMRVLAVDGDPTCLKVLECMLRHCQYHVTTTSLARTALKMLRENEDRFDLVITDVHMPDMDGFKLLELVGLELDLPVIMLSTNSNPKLVMKGVIHGACDYLMKPIRIEELRNIWQHVVRRKKYDSKKQSKPTYEDKDLQQNKEVCQGPLQSGNADQIGKLNKRKKDEEDEGAENRNEHEDPATQKKPRVVWSVELHRKFVAAVNQLGIGKAVPKRILDLMNVEGLTRVNVASHLQEYRLCLKRISSVASQPANMVAALGGLPTQQVPQQHTLQFNAQRPAQQSQHLDQLQTLPAEPLDSVNQPQPELFSSTSENVSQFRRLLRKITYGNESTSVNQVFSTGNESTSVKQEFSTDTIETSLHLRL